MNYYYAIQRKKDGRLISGTDFRYSPPHQILADEYRPPKLFTIRIKIESEILRRHINLKYYEVITVFPCEVKNEI